jgi:branched-chain amino acid aminotransferase
MNNGIRITKTTSPKPKPKDSALTFGTEFTDHMFLMDYRDDKGWYDARIEPYGPLSLDPATAVLHYAQSMFEGLKAFRGRDDRIRLFRPDKHVQRLNNTAKRLCIPTIDPEVVLKSWTTLVGLDRDWVPRAVGTSL